MPNKRALIVDDSTTAQYRLKQMLRAYTLDIDTVDSGEAALRYLATNVPDVIFMDHLMPGMDGFRALQIIKSHPETAMVPVIMYTSKSGDVYTGQARALGALDVVSKDTITAAELSNVMQAIHIYRTDRPESKPEQNIEKNGSAHTITEPLSPAIEITDLTHHSIERRAQNLANSEQARNLELRLSHMEHTLEDSRRFITARVLREIQSLKQNIKQEFNELVEHNHTVPEVVEPAPKENKFWSVIGKILILGLLGFIAFYLYQVNDNISQGQAQQHQISQQLNTLATAKPTETTATASAPPEALKNTATANYSTKNAAENFYLSDVAWTFNQSGLLPFNQINMDPKAAIRLYELLNRLINNGFKGRVWINIYVGNFCLAIDNYGQGQLPSNNITMNDCVLSADIYGLDKVKDQYEHEIESVLNGLNQTDTLIVINTIAEASGYPERKPNFNAKSWNMIAQNHNRLEIRLETPQEEMK